MLGPVDAAQAISELTEISPQVRDVAIVGADGAVVGTNVADETRARRLADGARQLVDAAESMRPGVAQLEAATVLGSVFVVRDGERLIAATTTPEPTVGLVFYDLKTCVRSIEESPKPSAARKRRAPAKQKEKGDAAA
jgi:predicted regulator of Ras-like GTPase activity (Roadblock/LC7/MglB family)